MPYIMAEGAYIGPLAASYGKGHLRKLYGLNIDIIYLHGLFLPLHLYALSCIFVELFAVYLPCRVHGRELLIASHERGYGSLYLLLGKLREFLPP